MGRRACHRDCAGKLRDRNARKLFTNLSVSLLQKGIALFQKALRAKAACFLLLPALINGKASTCLPAAARLRCVSSPISALPAPRPEIGPHQQLQTSRLGRRSTCQTTCYAARSTVHMLTCKKLLHQMCRRTSDDFPQISQQRRA